MAKFNSEQQEQQLDKCMELKTIIRANDFLFSWKTNGTEMEFFLGQNWNQYIQNQLITVAVAKATLKIVF